MLRPSRMVRPQKKLDVVNFSGFPHGLNTALPSSRIEKTECSELINWNIKKGGKLVNRCPITAYSSSPMTSNAAVKTIKRVITDNAKHGKLYLTGISGTFQGDEIIYESALGSELLGNPDFETYTGTQDDGTTDTFTSWLNSNIDATHTVEATATAQLGSNAVKLVRADAAMNNRISNFGYSITTLGGKYAQVSFYTRGDGTAQGKYAVFDRVNGANLIPPANTNIPGSTYTQIVSPVFAVPSNCNDFDISFKYKTGDIGTVYFDNASIKQVTNAALASGTLQTGDFLYYKKKTGDFTVGNTVTGATSGATATIAATGSVETTTNTLAVDENYVLHYLDENKAPVSFATLEGDTQIIPYNGVALLLDGSFIKYTDDLKTVKIAYDDGTGTSAYQFDHTAGDDDGSFQLGDGTNTRIATKFTSQAWETGYTIPPTTVTACLCKEGSPTGSITMKIRAVSGDTILASKTFLSDVSELTTTATEHSATFESSDITTEMSKSTAYYCTLEHSGGDADNCVHVHYSTVASGGTAYNYDGSYNTNTTENCLMSLKPGMPPKGRFGTIYESRPFIAGDPDNLGYVWYGNLTYLDWSSEDGGGYIGVVDDNRNNYEVGGLDVVYGNLMVYGTEAQPYLSQLSGGSPSDYILSPLFQNPWTTYKTLVNAKNDLWAGSSDGIDPLSGVREYGDFRTFSASDPVEDRILNYWNSSTAFAGYYPLEGQYWLIMPSYHRILIAHTKIPTEDPSGVGTRYPWTEYELYKDIFTSVAYKWTASGSGTNEYYLELAGGGSPSIATKPDFVTMDANVLDYSGSTGGELLIEDGGEFLLEGTGGSAMLEEGGMGSLDDHEWGYGDNDGLGYDTVYFRDDSGDPDITGIEIRSVMLPTALGSVGSLFLMGSSNGYIYQIDSSEYEDLGSHQVIPRLTTAYMEVPFVRANFIKYQLFASAEDDADIEAFFFVDNLTASKDSVATAMTVTDLPLANDINFNSRAVMVALKNIVLSGDPIYLNGFALEYRRMSY